MTPRSICVLALKQIGALGIGQTASPEDINDSFALLNMMMGQFSQKRWLIYHLVDVALPMTGQQAYTIGPGGDIDTPRPDRIESAFMRMGASPRTVSGGFQLDVSRLDVTQMDGPLVYAIAPPTLRSLDYPLDVIEAREDWNRVPFKAMPGFPASVFYDSAFPVGTIYVNPVPSTQFELHLSLKQALTSFANLSSDVNLPAQYHEALLYSLALRLAPMYGLPPRPDVDRLATAALSTIRTSNVQVGRLQMPGALAGLNRSGGYGGIGFGSFAFAGFGTGTVPVTVPGAGTGTGGTVTPPGTGGTGTGGTGTGTGGTGTGTGGTGTGTGGTGTGGTGTGTGSAVTITGGTVTVTNGTVTVVNGTGTITGGTITTTGGTITGVPSAVPGDTLTVTGGTGGTITSGTVTSTGGIGTITGGTGTVTGGSVTVTGGVVTVTGGVVTVAAGTGTGTGGGTGTISLATTSQLGQGVVGLAILGNSTGVSTGTGSGAGAGTGGTSAIPSMIIGQGVLGAMVLGPSKATTLPPPPTTGTSMRIGQGVLGTMILGT